MDDAQRAQLQAYLDELQRWNQRINLTAIPPEQAWEKHVGETQALLDAAQPPLGARVIDVGAGGGVPGMPMAILRPDLRVTLLDSDQRKAAFLTHVSGSLRLGNVEVVCARVEEVAHREGMREAFDLAVSRALAPPPVMCELTLPLVRVGGLAGALVSGAVPAADGDADGVASAVARAARVLGGSVLPTAVAGVLLIRKVASTPEQYPRRAGVPLRKPL
jgi:16S rRNA (guanine527-N7)-methyltransferase